MIVARDDSGRPLNEGAPSSGKAINEGASSSRDLPTTTSTGSCEEPQLTWRDFVDDVCKAQGKIGLPLLHVKMIHFIPGITICSLPPTDLPLILSLTGLPGPLPLTGLLHVYTPIGLEPSNKKGNSLRWF